MQVTTPILVIAGLTGAGKTLAIQQLEQLGYVGLEGIPPAHVVSLVEAMRPHHAALAISLNLRQPHYLEQLPTLDRWLQEQGIPFLFLEARPQVLLNRLSAHRRSHPRYLTTCGLLEAIEQEHLALRPARERCTHLLDTSDLNSQQLRQQLEALIEGIPQPLNLSLVSFGFKYGVPADANLMFDVRFLPNPFFQPQLRHLTGQDPVLQEFLFADPVTQSTYRQIFSLIQEFWPYYQAERRPHLTLAIGCTGGQHRSVALVERLAQDLRATLPGQGLPDLNIQVHHRHLLDSQRELEARFGPPPAVRSPDSHGTLVATAAIPVVPHG
ncbi:MAG: RNase adapter RapZ [Thermostichus sp. DG_1_6_bins_120]|uniref:RNase adapter RapZ n=1 Tax=uncultured Thermosynechococcus sp. TaxID=436945 RepID=UPI0026040672|nr:RNase adapter RapZ [uncultured Thermosynechococcus sp.]